MRTLFATVAAALLLAGQAIAQGQVWTIDPNHTAAQFSVRHLGISTVRGAFTKVTGSVHYEPAHPNTTVIEASIDARSIDTRVPMRDEDLRSAHFFDVATYPTVTFKSTRVAADGAGRLTVAGDLTMHGVTKEVVLNVEPPSAPAKDARGSLRIGTSATTRVSRGAFGMTGFAAVVGDEVLITIDLELVQP